VLAFRAGSVPEIVDPNVTGLIVDSVEEAIAALPRVLSFDRNAVRRRFEERFSAARMAHDYVGVYRDLLSRLPPDRHSPSGPRQLARRLQIQRNHLMGRVSDCQDCLSNHMALTLLPQSRAVCWS